jgi:hypothetical protein
MYSGGVLFSPFQLLNAGTQQFNFYPDVFLSVFYASYPRPEPIPVQ